MDTDHRGTIGDTVTKQKRFFASVASNMVTKAIWDARWGRMHERPDYTQADAESVAAWLNGKDTRLLVMASRTADPWDPAVRFPLRRSVRRV